MIIYHPGTYPTAMLCMRLQAVKRGSLLYPDLQAGPDAVVGHHINPAAASACCLYLSGFARRRHAGVAAEVSADRS